MWSTWENHQCIAIDFTIIKVMNMNNTVISTEQESLTTDVFVLASHNAISRRPIGRGRTSTAEFVSVSCTIVLNVPPSLTGARRFGMSAVVECCKYYCLYRWYLRGGKKPFSLAFLENLILSFLKRKGCLIWVWGYPQTSEIPLVSH